MNEQEDLRAAAIERITDRRDLRSHVAVYAAVNALLVVIWAATGAGYFWPIWVIGGWGFGLLMHTWQVLGQKPISEDDIRREMQHHLDATREPTDR